MKRIFLLFAILPLFANAQDLAPELIWGDNIRDMDMSFSGFVGKDENSLFALADKSGKLFLLEYKASNLSLVKETEISEPNEPMGDLRFELRMTNNAGIHIVKSGIDRSNKKVKLFHMSITLDGKASGYKEILSVDASWVSENRFEYSISEDDSKVLVYTYPNNDRSDNGHQAVVFDKNFKELYRTPLSSPFEDGLEFVPTETEISNSGDVYMLGYRKKASDRLLAAACQTEKYGVIQFDETGIANYHDLAQYEEKIHDLTLELDFDNKIILLGLYFTDERKYKSSNLFMSLKRNNLEPEKITFSNFSEEFLKNFDFNPKTKESYKYSMVTGRRKSTLKGLLRFKYKSLLSWPDGSFTVVGEREHILNESMGLVASHRDEIIIIKFNAEGEIVWANQIDRHQEEISEYSSYRVHHGGDKLHILFNDDSRNEENRAEGKEPFRFDAVGSKQKVHTLAATVDDEGNVSMNEIATYKGRRVLFTSHYFKWNDDTAFIFFRPDYLGGEHIVKIKF